MMLTRAQERRLERLEKDPEAKVMGLLPVVKHSDMFTGTIRNRSSAQRKPEGGLAVLKPDGRLSAIGANQEQTFLRTKR